MDTKYNNELDHSKGFNQESENDFSNIYEQEDFEDNEKLKALIRAIKKDLKD